MYSKNKQNTHLVVDSNNVQFSKQYFHCNMRHAIQLTIKWNCISFMCYTQYYRYMFTCMYFIVQSTNMYQCLCTYSERNCTKKALTTSIRDPFSPYNAFRLLRYPALAIELSAHTGWTKSKFGIYIHLSLLELNLNLRRPSIFSWKVFFF